MVPTTDLRCFRQIPAAAKVRVLGVGVVAPKPKDTPKHPRPKVQLAVESVFPMLLFVSSSFGKNNHTILNKTEANGSC